MDITENTTVEQINKPVEGARQRLIAAAASPLNNSLELAKRVSSLAWEEGARDVRNTYMMVLQGSLKEGYNTDLATQAAKQAVIGLLLLNADDTWSGRENDVRRSHADGVRAAAAVLVRGY